MVEIHTLKASKSNPQIERKTIPIREQAQIKKQIFDRCPQSTPTPSR